VQGRAGVAFGDGDFLKPGIIRLEKAFARAVHADASGNEVRFLWLDVAIALDARDFPGLFELTEDGLQCLLLLGGQAEEPQQFRHIRREVIFLSQQPDNLFFHDVWQSGFRVGGRVSRVKCQVWAGAGRSQNIGNTNGCFE
jgi:hypothetical protein